MVPVRLDKSEHPMVLWSCDLLGRMEATRPSSATSALSDRLESPGRPEVEPIPAAGRGSDGGGAVRRSVAGFDDDRAAVNR